MRPRHPACARLVHLVQDGFTEFSTFTLGPPWCFELRYACCEGVGCRDHPLRAAHCLAVGCVDGIEPVTRRVCGVLRPEALFRLDNCSLSLCRCIAQNWEKQLDERFVWRVICCPDHIEYFVQLLLCLNLSDEITIVHVCRKLLFDTNHSDIGTLK